MPFPQALAFLVLYCLAIVGLVLVLRWLADHYDL